MRKQVLRGGAIVLAATVLSSADGSQPSYRPRDHFAVRYVVDGDTLDVAGIGRVRLLGIDAPELGRGFETPAPFAREARDRLASLATGRYVRLESDGDTRDAYRRILAYAIRADGVVLNTEMIRAGLARVSARHALRRLGELRHAEEEAQRARRGMWGERPAIGERVFRIPR